MTSLLSGNESNAARMKQKLIRDAPAKEETRSFLNFSRENLSISHSDLEQGFNRSRLGRPSRNTILSVAALMAVVLCLGLQSWKLLSNTREIEQLRRDVDILKHRFLEENLIDELKAFEEQLYAEESTEDNDPGEADIDNADYDSNYDDGSASHDYSGDYHTPLTYGARSSDLLDISSTSSPSIPTSPDPGTNEDMVQLLAALRKVEAKRGHDFERNIQENHKNIERERLKGRHKGQSSHEEKMSNANSTGHKPEVIKKAASSGHIKESVKSKRSVNDGLNDDLVRDITNGKRHNTGRIVSRTHPYASSESDANDNPGTSPHPPKKYHANALETIPSGRRLGEEITQPDRYRSESTEVAGDRRVSWRSRDVSGNRTEIRRPVQVYAIHYGADSTLFSTQDEHTGNGRARHYNGIFRAWQPSEWVADLGMNRHFTLAGDGKLTVHEPGLYLVYAQIHYLDEHDENGFHMLVNGKPILQCMVYSPGMGHKSRSCFSAQAIVLQAGDHVVLKDIGSARYTLFQHDKSFFGLVKVGEPRQQQRHPSTYQ